MLDQLVVAGVVFGRNLIGIVTRPYETYRRIVDRGSLWEFCYIALVLAGYFALASLVKTASFRPFLLTKQFVALGTAASVGFVVAAGSLWIIGRLVGGTGELVKFFLAWGYTLVATVTWFLTTSLLYVILPPPRTERLEGVLFSALYLVFSTTLLLWKLTLAYLTLRFGLRLDLGKILLVAALAAPVLAGYSMLMYRLGIMKVPFL